MSNIIITSINLPEMFPVTQELSTIKVGGFTIAEQIKNRLQSACDSVEMVVRADFIPSMELAMQIANTTTSVNVLDPHDGTVLIRVRRQGTIETSELFADKNSIRIKYSWDLLTLNEKIVGSMSCDDIQGTVRAGATIDGFIKLGKNSVILPGVYIEGNVVIGENCKIGPNCYIRGNTSMGDNCHIGQAVEVKNSLFFNKVSIGHLSYVGDSVICNNVNFGAGTIVSNLRHDGKNHRFRIGNAFIDTKRRKFGAIIGENVHTGINTAIYPGRSLMPDASTIPGETVRR